MELVEALRLQTVGAYTFLPVRVREMVHGSHCDGDCGGLFECTGCRRMAGWCFGAADDQEDRCDECYEAPGASLDHEQENEAYGIEEEDLEEERLEEGRLAEEVDDIWIDLWCEAREEDRLRGAFEGRREEVAR